MSDYDSKIIRKQIRVYGSVQGVGFRYRTEHAAESVLHQDGFDTLFQQKVELF